MDRMLVIVFDGKAKASEGMRRLATLDDERAITIYAAECVTRDATGVATVEGSAAFAQSDAILATASRRLAAVLQRPAALGGPTMADLAQIGVEAAFVEEAGRAFSSGAVAIIAEIEEAGVLTVDGRIGRLSGRILRQARAPVADALNYCQLAASEEDLADLESEYARSNGVGRARLREPMGRAQARRDAARSLTRRGIDTRRREAEAKIRLLLRQAANGDDDRKAMIERQVAAIRAEYARWAAKLRAAWRIDVDPLSI